MLRNQNHLWIVYQGVYNKGRRNTLAQKTTAFKNVVFLQVWWLKNVNDLAGDIVTI